MPLFYVNPSPRRRRARRNAERRRVDSFAYPRTAIMQRRSEQRDAKARRSRQAQRAVFAQTYRRRTNPGTSRTSIAQWGGVRGPNRRPGAASGPYYPRYTSAKGKSRLRAAAYPSVESRTILAERAASRRAGVKPNPRRRRKLYGAATMAHARKSKSKRTRRVRRNPARRTEMAKKKRRRGGTKAARSRAAKKAARTRAMKKARRSAAARKSARKRRGARPGGRKAGHARRRKRAKHDVGGRSRRWFEQNPRRKRRRRRKARANAAPRRRRRRRHMRANPVRHVRRRRRYRRNPIRHRGPRRGGRYKKRRSGGRGPFRGRRRGGLYRKWRRNPAIVGGMIDAMKQAVPMALTLYLARYASSQIGVAVPSIGTSLGTYARPVVSLGMLGIGWFATAKVSFLRRWMPGIMAGLGINVIDSLMSAFAPVNVKSMFGLSGLGEYMMLGPMGAIPINDGTSLGEYVALNGALEEMGDYIEVEGLGAEEDLGALQSELGLESELGDDAANPVSVPSQG